jgi:apolipoprotein N-acyltransferase
LKALLWPRDGERLLPAISAILLALSFPPLHPLILPFVGLVPVALWIQALPPNAEGRRAAVRGSMVFGAIYFGSVFYWILVALIWFTKLAILAFLGSMVLLTGTAVLFGWMVHRMVHTVRLPMWLALPIAWTAAEWFRAHWPSSLSFPWLGLGSSLTGFPELVGVAELVGARGVTFWLALVNGLVAGLVLALREARPWTRHAAVIVAVTLMPMAWGVWRAGTLELRDAGRLAVVQPNIPEHIKLDRALVFDSTFASLDRLMSQVQPSSADVVILPEVLLPLYPMAPDPPGYLERIQRYSREVGAPLIFGGLGFRQDHSGQTAVFNSAFMMEPRGLASYQYDKRFLVPMVERIPFLPSSWLTGLQYFGAYGVGQGWPLAVVDETAFGVLICYESTYAEGARSLRLAGADVLLNITNDAWYGREPFYARTTALWQHPAHMVMRAIENRVGVARAANTGISLFVDPIGRVYNTTELFEADIRVDTVRTTDVITFYTRFGDLVGNGAAGAALLLMLASWRLARISPSLDPSAQRV